MDQSIALRKNTPTITGTGARTDSWATIDTVWAKWDQITGREFVANQQTNVESTDRFTIRYRTDIKAEWRITHKGRTLEVFAPPRTIGSRRESFLELTCKEINP